MGAPSGKGGRSATFTDAAIQACLTLKALFGLPLRQATGLVTSLLELAGLDWAVPDFSTLSRRQKGLKVAIPFRSSTGALHLLIDSTGIKSEGKGEWFAKKDGPSKPRQWSKVHLGIDADTLESRAIEVTGSRVGDAPMLPELLDQIPADQPIDKVTADGANDTGGCHTAIHCPVVHIYMPKRGGTLRLRRHTLAQERATLAGEHPRCPSQDPHRPLNAPPWSHDLAAPLGSILRMRLPNNGWSGYHRRSLVEAKMRCFKLLGERVKARDFDRQVAELQIRAAILNRSTALGPPQTQRSG